MWKKAKIKELLKLVLFSLLTPINTQNDDKNINSMSGIPLMV